MRIKRLVISNYRNLEDIKIDFKKDINFIVGDNNIGKTNTLMLLDSLFNKNFNDKDYNNPKKEINIKLELFNNEKTNDYNEYNIKYFNDTLKTYKNNEIIDNNIIKKIHFKVFKNNNEGSLIDPSKIIYDELLKIKNNYIILDNKKTISLIIAIDEPEMHLNPYMQRSLIEKYKRLLKNEDEDFLTKIKNELDIDCILGQLIIVTHSTDSLMDDYRSIIRFYKTDKIYASCGINFKFEPDVLKHLLMMFQDIKEAFFSKKALIVEGITEFGAFKGFSKTMGISFDEYGICLINAMGEGAISKINKLLTKFKIDCYMVYDRDVLFNKKVLKNEFYTESCCFEMEIVDTLINNNAFDTLEYISSIIPNYNRQRFDYNYVKKCFLKINYHGRITKPKLLSEYKRDDIMMYKALHFTWLYNNKGIFLGRFIGNILDINLIPKSYKEAIIACINN